MDQQVSPNITMLNDGEVSRYLSATTWNQDFGWSAASTVNTRTAKTLGSLWEYVGRFNLGAFNIGRPIFIPSMTDGPMMKPLVQVQCGQVYDAGNASTISFPWDYLTAPLAYYGQSSNWTMQPPASGFTTGHVNFEWVSLLQEQAPYIPVIGASE